MSASQAEALRQGVAARANILVAGGTSTGKTTLTNALLAEVAKTDRVVIIEDTRELQCAAPNLVAMRTKDGVASLSISSAPRCACAPTASRSARCAAPKRSTS
jgi:type IV secretion system protein VirB11